MRINLVILFVLSESVYSPYHYKGQDGSRFVHDWCSVYLYSSITGPSLVLTQSLFPSFPPHCTIKASVAPCAKSKDNKDSSVQWSPNRWLCVYHVYLVGQLGLSRNLCSSQNVICHMPLVCTWGQTYSFAASAQNKDDIRQTKTPWPILKYREV